MHLCQYSIGSGKVTASTCNYNTAAKLGEVLGPDASDSISWSAQRLLQAMLATGMGTRAREQRQQLHLLSLMAEVFCCTTQTL